MRADLHWRYLNVKKEPSILTEGVLN